jgi:hypothetical protein
MECSGNRLVRKASHHSITPAKRPCFDSKPGPHFAVRRPLNPAVLLDDPDFSLLTLRKQTQPQIPPVISVPPAVGFSSSPGRSFNE